MSFRDVAIQATTTSKLMENRTRISTDEILTKYPEGVTVYAFDFMNGDNGHYPVCVFKENDNECFFGGSGLTDICEQWMAGYDTTEECSEALAAEGGVKIKFVKTRTKNNRTFVKCEVI